MDTVDETQEEVESHQGSLFADLQDGFEEALEHEEGKETSIELHDVDTHETVIDDLKPYGQETVEEQYDEFGNPISLEEFAEAHHKKKITGSSEELKRLTIDEIEILEKEDDEWIINKREWKKRNPDKTLKSYKKAYVNEKITTLPWDPRRQSEYKQNDEQNENSIWNKIRDGRSSSNST